MLLEQPLVRSEELLEALDALGLLLGGQAAVAIGVPRHRLRAKGRLDLRRGRRCKLAVARGQPFV